MEPKDAKMYEFKSSSFLPFQAHILRLPAASSAVIFSPALVRGSLLEFQSNTSALPGHMNVSNQAIRY